MEAVEHFVREWGYWAVFLGACVEGESVILLACYFASQGHLSWPGIISLAFVATLVADQGLFLVGHYHGPKIFKRFPILKTKSQRVFDLLHRFDTWFILSFRFIYGIRVASPLILGASGLPLGRFARLNVVAAIIWTAVSFSFGYVFAQSIHGLLERFSTIKPYLIGGGVALVFIIWAGYRFWKLRTQNTSSA